ncbi:MAG TPA: M36 family metallopeptidase, partial [Solimonas sp.]|nr:M36 family metallopeptidase [Solimonas sp.]
GNHVDACIDTYDTQGVPIAVPPPVNACVSGVELRAKPTSDHTFDYPIGADEDPSTASAQNAAVVSMFYLVNWLHDWWYDHGFDEASGNAQTSNYGRGGIEGDPLLAQGQDGSGRNNANMATPADGSSPVMQQYLFNGPVKGAVTITAPAIGEIPFNGVEYGPQTFDYTGVAVLANDGFDPAGDGCTGLSTPAVPVELPLFGAPPQVPVPVLAPDPKLAGKIAVIDRGGGCPGSYKVRWALLSGASAVMLVHNADGPPPFLANGDVPIDAPVQPTNNVYQLPIVTIRKDDGQRIKDAIAAGQAVTVHLKRDASVDFDGTLDNLIIAHEYFHYVHHRLTESSNPQADAMSEGWGDIDAFMLSARTDDRAAPGNEHFQGAYAAASYVTNDFYFGIRRAPYSTDLRKNPLTFKHISEGEALPQGEAPVNGDPTGNGNSEVHSAGEIWANAVWECYTGLLNDPRHSFEQAQSRMQDYIIGGLKMTPADATYTEARDAILAVALANDVQDYKACSRGFAKRGMGLNAVSPARASTDLVGVVEDYSEFVCAGGSALPVPTPVGGGGTVDQGRYGGGALNLVLILPLLGLALRRRRPRAAQARKG